MPYLNPPPVLTVRVAPPVKQKIEKLARRLKMSQNELLDLIIRKELRMLEDARQVGELLRMRFEL